MDYIQHQEIIHRSEAIRISLYPGGVPDGDGGVGVPKTGDDGLGGGVPENGDDGLGGGVAETGDDVVGGGVAETGDVVVGGGVVETGDVVVGGDEEEEDVGKMQDPTPICKSKMGISI